jgi:hypothetical protein
MEMNRATTKELLLLVFLIFFAVGFILGVVYCKSEGNDKNNSIMDAYDSAGNESTYTDKGNPPSPPKGTRFVEDYDEENAPNDPFIREKEDAYGLGVDMDQYGRPVREEVITGDE